MFKWYQCMRNDSNKLDSIYILSEYFDFRVGYLRLFSIRLLPEASTYFLTGISGKNQFLQSSWGVLQKAGGSLFSKEMWATGLHSVA